MNDRDDADPLREVIKQGLRSQTARVDPIIWTVPYEVSSDDYAKCLTPRNALVRYDLSSSLAITQLIRELSAELVQAICQVLIFKKDGIEQRAEFMLVPSWIWRISAPKPEDDFWETGYIEANIPSSEGHTFSHNWIKMFGIAFWPGGLPGGEQPDATSTDLQNYNQKPLGEAERKRFCELYLKIWGDAATETKALNAAKATFPDNIVSRDPFNATFRAIRGPAKPGKRSLRG